jgi:tripartite-type tricarboxylate transporter receptor subunit TctC
MAEDLGVKIIPSNLIGASGAIGADFVKKAKPDGSYLMIVPETACLWPVMGISEMNIWDFEPLIIFTMGIPTITVRSDAKWKTAKELLEDAKGRKEGNYILHGSSGPATSGDVCAILLKRGTGAKFRDIPFAGGGPAVIATLGGNVETTFQSLSEVIEHVRAGKLRLLATFTNERVMPDVPALGEQYPDMKKYLPWGPWWGLAAPKGLPDDVRKKVVESAIKAGNDKRFHDRMKVKYVKVVNYTGEEMTRFIKNWSAVTTWLLYKGGRAQHSPAKFGMPDPFK